MKKISILTSITFSLLMMVSVNSFAQDFPDLDKSPMDAATFPGNYKVSEKMIKVIYSRPQLKGRTLAKLVPNDEVWRTGANEATELTLYADMNFGTTKVKAGTYSMFTIPGEKEWTVILSKDLNVWGSYTYNKANDVARMTVPAQKTKSTLEAFSIVFDETKSGADMFIGWGDVMIAVPFNKL